MKLPDVIFSAGLDRALGWTMLHSIWQATLIALLAGILLLVLRRQSAQLRYGVANLALVAILLSAAGTFYYYLQLPPVADSGVVTTQQSVLPVPTTAAESTTPIPPPTLTDATTPAVTENNVSTSFRAYFTEHLPLIVAIWFLGMTIFLCRLLGGISNAYYLRHRMNFPTDPYWSDVLNRFASQSNFHKNIALLESALVRSPLTIGHLKPVILFPIGLINRLSESEVEAILAHELAHILRRDYIFNILQSVVEVIFYFHPAVWWLSAQVRQERESACDDRAIALLGNKLNYAKALVTIQEMAFYPLSPALAFAGTKRNQLLVRVQRLFSPPTTKFNIMEKWIATGLVVCSLMVLAFGQHIQNTNTSTGTEAFTHNSGLWEADFNGDSVCMTFSSKTKHNNWVNGECFAKNNFANLTVTPGETAFQMIRPAGTMSMTGKIEGTTGYGRFQFAPSDSYRTVLTQQGIKEVDDELLLHCFFANFPTDFIGFLKKTGYSTVSKEELLELAIFRLDEVAIRGYLALAASLGKKNVPLQQLVELKIANVSPERVAQLAKAGYTDLDLSEVSQLSLHNVNPAFIDSMNAMGFGKLSFEDMISMRIHGIDAEFVQQSQSMGLGQLELDDIMSMRIHGIDTEFVKKAQQMELGKLSLEDLMNIRIHGVTPELAETFRDMDFKNLTVEDLVSARIHNVTPEFITEANKKGYRFPTLQEYADLKVRSQFKRRAE